MSAPSALRSGIQLSRHVQCVKQISCLHIGCVDSRIKLRGFISGCQPNSSKDQGNAYAPRVGSSYRAKFHAANELVEFFELSNTFTLPGTRVMRRPEVDIFSGYHHVMSAYNAGHESKNVNNILKDSLSKVCTFKASGGGGGGSKRENLLLFSY